VKVFVSWSGDRSRAVAEALVQWLPRVINAIDPWISTEMEKGTRSASEMANALEATRFGIICLTRDNLSEPWVHFEAGALSKTRDARVWTFLLDITYTDIQAPLSQFQHTQAVRDDARKMITAMNTAVRESGERALDDRILDEQFSDLWPKLEAALAAIPKAKGAKQPVRSDRELLEEIVELVRQAQRGTELQQVATLFRPVRRMVPYYVRFDVPREKVESVLSEAVKHGLLASYQFSPATDGEERFRVRSFRSASELEEAFVSLELPVKRIAKAATISQLIGKPPPT